ncbi:MAG: hypothetical protein WC565_05455 [Parcubacteria group bacterium]
MQVIKRPFLEKKIKKIFWIPVAAVFLLCSVFSVFQYKAWKESPVMKFAFETDNWILPFAYNVFIKYFAPYVLALALAALMALAMMWVNKRSRGRFFERDEIFIAFIAGFLAGFPGFLFFILGIVIAYLLTHLINAIFRKTARSEVIPLYYFWLPVSAFVIIISEIWLSKLPFWSLLIV